MYRIDMNEPANFCLHPCEDPEAEAKRQGMPPKPPPVRSPPRQIPGYNFTHQSRALSDSINLSLNIIEAENIIQGFSGLDDVIKLEDVENMISLDKRNNDDDDLLYPPYQIANGGGKLNSLSHRTVDTDVIHYNGLTEYNLHNIYGTSKLIFLAHSAIGRKTG